MLILCEYFKTKIKEISPLERMLHCVKIDKFKKMTLYKSKGLVTSFIAANAISIACIAYTDIVSSIAGNAISILDSLYSYSSQC